MITRSELEQARREAWESVLRSGLVLREEEIEAIEVADFGSGDLRRVGAQILTLETNEWVSVKLLILSAWQFEPQHRHPPNPADGYPGKTEVLRTQSGTMYLALPGERTPDPQARPPADWTEHLTVHREVVLVPGDQYTIPPNTWHWFQAGPEGCVTWTISSKATDAADQFSDPRVVRQTRVREDL